MRTREQTEADKALAEAIDHAAHSYDSDIEGYLLGDYLTISTHLKYAEDGSSSTYTVIPTRDGEMPDGEMPDYRILGLLAYAKILVETGVFNSTPAQEDDE